MWSGLTRKMMEQTGVNFSLIEREEHKESSAWAFTQYDDVTSQDSKKSQWLLSQWAKTYLTSPIFLFVCSSTHSVLNLHSDLKHTSIETPSTRTHVFKHTQMSAL